MLTAVIGERGQITIPKQIRDKLLLKPKSTVIIELKNNVILIKPCAVVELREFSDEFVDELIREDTLKKGEREKILQKWSS